MRLSAKLDHVATLRQARGGKDPDPVAAALLAELAGAHGITVHLRSDRRHIQERDLYLLAEACRLPLNVEAAMTPDSLKVLREVKPSRVTLVPEPDGAPSSSAGLDLSMSGEEIAEYMALYREAGIAVSLRIEPEPETVRLAGRLAPEIVELNTSGYGLAADGAPRLDALRRIAEAARQASRLKLAVHAGHELHYRNLPDLAAGVPEIEEASVGHALIARAALSGMDRAVRDMLAILSPAGGTS